MSKKDELNCLMTMTNLGDYVDKWIALVGDEVVAVGEKGTEVYEKSKKRYPDAVPMILKVPSDKIMLL